MKKILLIAESDSSNLGDQLISELIYELCKKFADTKIEQYPISHARHYFIVKAIYKIAHWLHLDYIYDYSVQLATYLCIKNKIDKDTFIIFSGGQMFINYFMDPIISILKYSAKKGAAVYFNACGSGDINEHYRKQIQPYLKNCEISLRDSVEQFKAIAPNAYYRPDIAITTSKIFPIEKSQSQSNTIGWGVINTIAYNFHNRETPITDEWYLECSHKAILDIINKEQCRVEIFTNGGEVDYKWAQMLKEKFSDNPQVTLAPRPTNVSMLLNDINKYRYIVASRMHALIIAYSYKIPFIALRWENKIDDFARQTNCTQRVWDISKMEEINWETTIEELRSNGLDLDIHKELQSKALEGMKNISEKIK